MRIAQGNTYNFQDLPFFSSKPSYDQSSEKHAYFTQNLNEFLNQLNSIEDIGGIINAFILSLKKYLSVYDANIFLVNESADELIPLVKSKSVLIEKMIYAERTGVFEWIFENDKPAVIPEKKLLNDDTNNFTLGFFPIQENKKKRGVFVFVSDLKDTEFSDFHTYVINSYINIVILKIDKQILKDKLNSTYNNLQVYQAKLANDFRYSTIGEMTEGFVEDILSPLQNIVSYVDMLFPSPSHQGAQFIKGQVTKIQDVIKRLVKFANINEVKSEYQPSDLNAAVSSFYQLVKSSLEALKIECVLDLDNNLPSILSHPNYISQMLTNIFTLIKSSAETFSIRNGGIILQTRYLLDYVILEIISTISVKEYLLEMKKVENNAPFLNLKIIENLMNKHEGDFKIESSGSSGTKIVLKFPLNRKMK